MDLWVALTRAPPTFDQTSEPLLLDREAGERQDVRWGALDFGSFVNVSEAEGARLEPVTHFQT